MSTPRPLTPSEWIKHRIQNEAIPFYRKGHKSNLATLNKLSNNLDNKYNEIMLDTPPDAKREKVVTPILNSKGEKIGEDTKYPYHSPYKNLSAEEKNLCLFRAYVKIVEHRYQEKLDEWLNKRTLFSRTKTADDFIKVLNENQKTKHESRILASLLCEIYTNYSSLLESGHRKLSVGINSEGTITLDMTKAFTSGVPPIAPSSEYKPSSRRS